MIISNQNKCIFLLTPKTASQSSHKTIISNCPDIAFETKGHENAEYAVKGFKGQFNLDPKMLDDYKVFAFYRDPIDRFISGAVYFKRRFVGEMTNLFYSRFTHRRASNYIVDSSEYPLLPAGLKEEIEAISIEDIMSIPQICNPETGNLVFTKQVNWLDCPNITLLNYHDYNNEIKKVVEAFGGTVTDDQIAKINTSIRYETDTLSEESIAKVKEMYKEDYEFFEKNGIHF